MPIGKSAKKSLRQALRNKKTNWDFKSQLKEAVKKFLADPTEKAYVEAQSMLDKAIKKNIWHRNKIARVKSHLAKKIGKPVEAVVKKVKKVKKIVKKTVKKVVK